MIIESQIKVFSGSTGKEFSERVCKDLNLELGKSRTIRFTEGNIYVKADENVRGKDIFLIQSIGLNPNDEFTEILFWIDAFKRASAKSVTLVMPYFSYAKGDKKDEPRVSIRGRVCAECIELAGIDRVVTMDLHSPQIQGFFKKPVDNLSAMPILCEYIKSLRIEDVIVVSPDSGHAKEARRFARYLSVPVAIGDKERSGYEADASIVEIVGNVEGKNAVIVDDFSITGGTLFNISKELKKRGAKKIIACLSHILLNDKGIDRLMDSDIELLISTDTVNNPYVHECEKIKILSVAPFFAETIRRIHKGESVSSLFHEVPIHVLEIED